MTVFDKHEAAFQDVEGMVPWAEPNWIANNDDRLSAAVERGLGGTVAPDVPAATPLLRFANVELPAMSLLDAVLDPPQLANRRCDRCPRRFTVTGLLWVPCGDSVVEVAVCWKCRCYLDRQTVSPYREVSTFVWREPRD